MQLESFGRVEIKTTGTMVEFCLNEKKQPVVVLTTAEVETFLTEEGSVLSEEWDVVKFCINSGLLRRAFTEHLGLFAETVGIGIKNALEEKGYS